MWIAITLLSILLLTAFALLVRKVALPWLCPLCAGVAGTWLWLLGAHFAGFEVDLRLPAILLGGSVVGLAAQAEKLLAGRGEGYLLVWKTLFVSVGFATAWFITTLVWGGVAVGLATLGVITVLPGLTVSAPGGAGRIERLKEQMKNCC
jgi:hypothetical protein